MLSNYLYILILLKFEIQIYAFDLKNHIQTNFVLFYVYYVEIWDIILDFLQERDAFMYITSYTLQSLTKESLAIRKWLNLEILPKSQSTNVSNIFV